MQQSTDKDFSFECMAYSRAFFEYHLQSSVIQR